MLEVEESPLPTPVPEEGEANFTASHLALSTHRPDKTVRSYVKDKKTLRELALLERELRTHVRGWYVCVVFFQEASVAQARASLEAAQADLRRVKLGPQPDPDELYHYEEVVEQCWTTLNESERQADETDLRLFR